MKKPRNVPHVRVSDIRDQAQEIREIMDDIIAACDSGEACRPYARAVVAGGDIAKKAAILCIYLTAYENQEEE